MHLRGDAKLCGLHGPYSFFLTFCPTFHSSFESTFRIFRAQWQQHIYNILVRAYPTFSRIFTMESEMNGRTRTRKFRLLATLEALKSNHTKLRCISAAVCFTTRKYPDFVAWQTGILYSLSLDVRNVFVVLHSGKVDLFPFSSG